jgi:hypothetical protein
LFPLASDAVLLAATTFHKFAWTGDTDLTGEAYDQEFKRMYATLIVEIREEVYEATQLPTDIVEDRLPFNF